MKGLKKLVLVSAIAATPLVANAQLKALNDSTLGSVTGQAGVTVEVQTQIGIGSIVYTDTAGSSGIGGGKFAISGVAIGGAGVATAAQTSGLTASAALSACNSGGTQCNLDNLAFNIDVDSTGTAVISLTNFNQQPVDFGVVVDSMGTQDSSGANGTVLLSNMSMVGNLYALDITVGQASGGNQFGSGNAYAETDTNAHINAAYATISGKVTGTSAPAPSSALLGPMAAPSPTDAAGNAVTSGALDMAVAFSVNNMQFDAPLMGVGVRQMTIGGAGTNAYLDGGAGAAAVLPAGVELAVYAGDSMMGNDTALNGAALHVDVQTTPMDIRMGQVLMGGNNIGTVEINGLQLSNTKLVVYGH